MKVWFFNDPGLPLNESNGQHEYGAGIWAKYLDKKYGTVTLRSEDPLLDARADVRLPLSENASESSIKKWDTEE